MNIKKKNIIKTKPRGFTLIELLATILILAVVTLIAVPTILNVVESSRKKAFEVSVLSLFDSLKIYTTKNVFPEEGINTTPEGLKDVPIDKVSFNGGTVQYTDHSFSAECVTNGTYYAVGSRDSLKVYKDRCGVSVDDDNTNPIINIIQVDNINKNSFRVVLNVTEEETVLTYYYSLNKESLKKVYETGVCDDDCVESDKNYHTFTDLTKDTNYEVYVLVKDAANNYNDPTSLSIDGTPVSKYDNPIKTRDFNLPDCKITKVFIGLQEKDYEGWGTSKEVTCTFDTGLDLNSYYKTGSEDWKPINQSSLVFMIDKPYQTIYVKTNEMLGQTLTVGKIDTVKPTIPTLSGGGDWTKNNRTIVAASTDNESGINSYEYLECPTNNLCDISNAVSVTGLSTIKTYSAEGISYVFVRSKDNVGNYSSWQLNSQMVRIDKTKPTVTFNPESKSADNDARNTHSTIPTITETLSGINNCNYLWNTSDTSPTDLTGFAGANSGSCTNNTAITTPSGLITNNYRLHIYIADNAGNVTIDKADGSFNVDNTKPVCVWSASPSSTNLKNGSIATYKITCTDANELKDNSISVSDIEQIKTGMPNASINVSAPSVSGTTYVYTVTVTVGAGDGTIALRLKANSIFDYADNTNNISGNSTTISIDNTKPVCIWKSGPSVSYIKSTSTSVYSLECTESDGLNNNSLLASNFTINKSGTANATISVSAPSVSGDKYTYNVTVTTGTGDGNVTLSLNANSLQDKSGNSNDKSANSSAVIIDNTAPVCTWVTSPSNTPIKSGETTSYTLDCSDANGLSGTSVTTLAASDITKSVINPVTTISTPTKTAITNGYRYVFTVTGGTGNGAVSFSIPANKIKDQAGNSNVIKTSSAVTIDNTPPVCVWTASPNTTYIKSGNLATYTLTCTDANKLSDSTITTSDFDIIKNGAPNASISVSAPSVSGTTYAYTITLSAGTGDGTVALRLKSGVIIDNSNNSNGASANSNVITIDNIAPICTWKNGTTSYLRNGSPTILNLECTEAIGFTNNSLTISNFTVTKTGTANASISSVTGPEVLGTKYTYAIVLNASTGDGNVTLSLNANSLQDKSGNHNIKSAESSAIVIDNTAPVCNWVLGPSKSPIKSGVTTTYTLDCSDANGLSGASATTLAASDITKSATSPASTVSAPTKTAIINGYRYVFTITGGTGNGTVTFTIPANKIKDQAGNSNAAKNSSVVIIDNTLPVCVWTSGPSSSNLKNGGTATYVLTCTDANRLSDSTITASDFDQIKTGAPNATVSVSAPSVSGNSYVYTITLTGGTGDGTVALRLKAGSIIDNSNNSNVASANSSTVRVDNTVPTCTWLAGSTTYLKNGNSTILNLECTEDIGLANLSLSSGNFTVTKTGTANATVGSVLGPNISGTKYTYAVTVTSGTGDGNVTFRLNANALKDAAGNGNAISGASSTVVIDNTAPVCTWVSGPSKSRIKSGATTAYTLDCTDAHGLSGASTTTVGAGDITKSTTSPATTIATPSKTAITNGYRYGITVTAGAGNGNVTFSIPAGKIKDQAGNANVIKTSSAVTIDNVAPTCTISRNTDNVVSGNQVTFTITFSENLTSNIATGNVAVTNGTKGTFTTITSARTYSQLVTTTSSTTSGTFATTASVAAGIVSDAAGNTNTACSNTINVKGLCYATNVGTTTWSGTCSKTCGGGTESGTTKIVSAYNSSVQCGTSATSRPCNTQTCCTVGTWSNHATYGQICINNANSSSSQECNGWYNPSSFTFIGCYTYNATNTSHPSYYIGCSSGTIYKCPGQWQCGGSAGTCNSWTTVYSYYCPSGWNNYSGSGSTLKCYRAAQ